MTQTQEVQPPQKKARHPFVHMVIGGVAGYLAYEFGPMMEGGIINPFPSLAVCISAVNAALVISTGCKRLAHYCDYCLSSLPVGYKATSQWSTYSEVKAISQKYNWNVYWGVYAGDDPQCKKVSVKRKSEPLIVSYSSNAVTFGAAGSGKDIGVVIPNILSLKTSKIIFDFKSNLAVMLHSALKKRGENVLILNIGGLYEDKLGESASYNPLDLITDHFETSGGLQDVVGDCTEMAHQLYPDPADGGDDKFWRDGSSNFITFCIQHVVLVYGRTANMSHVAQMLADRSMFLKDCQWAAGMLTDKDGNLLPAMPLETAHWTKYHDEQQVQNYIAYYRAKASGLADLLSASDNRTADSFLTGARQALADFNVTSRAGKVLHSSTFRFADLKDAKQITSVFLSLDASRMTSQAKIVSLIQFCAFTELKRHKNHHVPVHIIANESTNAKIYDLPSLLTWGREYGIRIHLFIQSMGAFRSVYGKEAETSLISQCEVLQFLRGQKGEMLDLIQKLLGEKSYVERSNSGRFHGHEMQGHSLSEHVRPLMTVDEIRRNPFTLLFIRHHPPILTNLPPYAAIDPWRNMVSPNPMRGEKKKWKLPIQLRLGSRKPPILRRLFSLFTGGVL